MTPLWLNRSVKTDDGEGSRGRQGCNQAWAIIWNDQNVKNRGVESGQGGVKGV